MLGFEPGTSPVPSRYATNRAILAWIIVQVVVIFYFSKKIQLFLFCSFLMMQFFFYLLSFPNIVLDDVISPRAKMEFAKPDCLSLLPYASLLVVSLVNYILSSFSRNLEKQEMGNLYQPNPLSWKLKNGK